MLGAACCAVPCRSTGNELLAVPQPGRSSVPCCQLDRNAGLRAQPSHTHTVHTWGCGHSAALAPLLLQPPPGLLNSDGLWTRCVKPCSFRVISDSSSRCSACSARGV